MFSFALIRVIRGQKLVRTKQDYATKSTKSTKYRGSPRLFFVLLVSLVLFVAN